MMGTDAHCGKGETIVKEGKDMCGGGSWRPEKIVTTAEYLSNFKNKMEYYIANNKEPYKYDAEINMVLERYLGNQLFKGIFVETVRGCTNYKCQLRCPEKGKPVVMLPYDEVNQIVKIITEWRKLNYISFDCILYGNGDVDSFDLTKVALTKDWAVWEVTITHNIEKYWDLSNINPNLNYYFRLSNMEDVEAYKKVQGKKGAYIVIDKKMPYVEILHELMCTGKTIKVKSNDNPQDYVTKYDFIQAMKAGAIRSALEIMFNKNENKLTPVVEGYKDGVLTIRRCFAPDSPKFQLNTKGKSPEVQYLEFIYHLVSNINLGKREFNFDCQKYCKNFGLTQKWEAEVSYSSARVFRSLEEVRKYHRKEWNFTFDEWLEIGKIVDRHLPYLLHLGGYGKGGPDADKDYLD